jgi:hypothetical protein
MRISADNLLSADQVKARAQSCKELKVCFINLKPLGDMFISIVHPVAGEVMVHAQFISEPLIGTASM